MKKKGDADIVATVLLIVSAIAIAILVTTFSKQTEEKVSERIVSLGNSVDCEDIRLSIESYDTGTGVMNVRNRGTRSAKSVVIRVYGLERIDTFDKKFDNCPADSIKDGKLLPQQACPLNVPFVQGAYKIDIIPVIELEEEDMGCENKISIWQE